MQCHSLVWPVLACQVGWSFPSAWRAGYDGACNTDDAHGLRSLMGWWHSLHERIWNKPCDTMFHQLPPERCRLETRNYKIFFFIHDIKSSSMRVLESRQTWGWISWTGALSSKEYWWCIKMETYVMQRCRFVKTFWYKTEKTLKFLDIDPCAFAF